MPKILSMCQANTIAQVFECAVKKLPIIKELELVHKFDTIKGVELIGTNEVRVYHYNHTTGMLVSTVQTIKQTIEPMCIKCEKYNAQIILDWFDELYSFARNPEDKVITATVVYSDDNNPDITETMIYVMYRSASGNLEYEFEYYEDFFIDGD